MLAPEPRQRLDQFDAKVGLDRGVSRPVEILWYLLKCLFFLSPLPWPNALKRFILRTFGAKLGEGIVIKPRVNIHFPWKLTIGDHCWIGEEVFILNFEPIQLGNNVCLSQRSFLCGGNHDFRDPTFSYRNGPITIHDGAWVGAQCFVGPNVAIEQYAVIVAGSVVTSDLPGSMICRGNPCQAIKPRWPNRQRPDDHHDLTSDTARLTCPNEIPQ
ncbi:WcaF family extracellular polysaccharide biosynthesis acetyltransferase [Stieleria sp. JC731]|uniref:WcaF family extracellular polysaccharide biosynthesis acetyltransferase n=1 Tax=Pirellulaceae TaxID=2691357 RepID=UPI001E47A47E|nr:WcaF family extracellular polysaccharide biosynthesis acetyltransferase [Stieleria sp. JC731]MCC9599939.1 WcaF family extracellular polysaccharide biosynthesis acetyltransferase [Stieleria sp. JC731]